MHTLLMAVTEPAFLPLSTSRPLSVGAGFQLSISGRFWVSTEENAPCGASIAFLDNTGKCSVDVALFLPFRCNKVPANRSKAPAQSEGRKSADSTKDARAIRQRPAHGRKGRLTLLFPPVNRRVAGSSPA